jgi:hypothetical protein
MKHLIQPLAVLFAIASLHLNAQTNAYYYDDRGYKAADLYVLADASFSAKKMRLDFKNIDQRNSWLEYDLAELVVDSMFFTAVNDKIASSSFVAWLGQHLPEFVFKYASIVGWVYTAAQVIATVNANISNTKERNYLFVAPAAGRYQLKVWVPGDWNKPCSMIKVYSVDTDTKTRVLKYSYDQTNVSDRTETIAVDLPAGLVQVSVSVGSGTLLTHTAGHMVDAMLDNPTNVQWTVPSIPIASSVVNLAPSLPYVGSTCTIALPYTNAGALPNLIDGSVSYTNHTALAIIAPLPPAAVVQRSQGIPDPNDPQPPVPEVVQNTINMDVVEASAPALDGQTAIFSFLRLDDFISAGRIHTVFCP